MESKPISAFLGVNTKVPDESMKTDKGWWLRDALNVVIRNDGSIQRRAAAVREVAVAAPHSLYGDLLVRAGALYRVTFSPYTETLLQVLASNAPMSYAQIGECIYCTNGVDALRVTAATVKPWALPAPSAPTCSGIGGGLTPGNHLVQTAFYDESTGVEGCLSPAVEVTTSDLLGGIRVTVPGAPTGATHFRVYISRADGGVLQLAAEVAAIDPMADVVLTPTGAAAHFRVEAPLPPGSRVFAYNQRLCVIDGGTLYIGAPFRHGYYEPATGAVYFRKQIKVAIGNVAAGQSGGIYVVTDKTVFLRGGDPQQPEVVDATIPLGAVPGTEFEHPSESIVGWFSDYGIVQADANGGIKVPMESIKVTPPASGVSTVVRYRNVPYAVSCNWCLNLDTTAASRFDWPAFTSADGGRATFVDGVYSLMESGRVDAVIDLGKESFGTEKEKQVPSCYIGVASEDAMVLVAGDGTTEYEYPARSFSEELDIHRVDLGRGLRVNWLNLKIKNQLGADFALSSLSFVPLASHRRI